MDENIKNEKTKEEKHITLYDMLNIGTFTFTLAEIEEIMDEELASPIETMDTDLIDLCASILIEAANNN